MLKAEFNWIFLEKTNFVSNYVTAICLISSTQDDTKQTMGRHPKLKLYHSSSKRPDIAVTSPTRRQACCWIPKKSQITQSIRTQPAQNPLLEIYKRTFAVITEPLQWNRSAAYTFCTVVKCLLTCQSLHFCTLNFQPHSSHFLKGTPLQ